MHLEPNVNPLTAVLWRELSKVWINEWTNEWTNDRSQRHRFANDSFFENTPKRVIQPGSSWRNPAEPAKSK
jgi:hypothetical protein